MPLRGRRVRGWVVAMAEALTEDLAEVAGVSGRAPVFDDMLLASARAMAHRAVHPLAAFLHLMTPPRMGRRMGRGTEGPADADHDVQLEFPLAIRTVRRLGPSESAVAVYEEAIGACLATGRSAIVVVPEVRAGSVVLEGLARAFGEAAAVVHSAQGEAERSAALWSVARGERRVVLGGRAAVMAPARGVGLIAVHGEEDRTLKAEQAPYYDARVAAEIRATCSGADLLVASQTPTVATWIRARTGSQRGWRVVEPSLTDLRRGWPAIRPVPPERGVMLAAPLMAAVLRAWRSGTRVLVLVPRRAATVTGPGPAEIAAHLRRAVPGAEVRLVEPPVESATLDAPIVVATEGVLAEVERPAVGTALALGVDALLASPHGQAAEHAFVTLWELAAVVARAAGRAGQVLLETDRREHHAVQAVLRADYDLFARREAEARREAHVPPYATLVRIRGSAGRRRASGGGIGTGTLDALAALPGTEVLGPVEGRLGAEVLLKVGDIDAVLDPLRAIMASAPQRCVVDMDPREW